MNFERQQHHYRIMIVSHLSRIDESFIFSLLGTTKLAMNAVFGKTMENVRTHLNIELLPSAKVAKKESLNSISRGLNTFMIICSLLNLQGKELLKCLSIHIYTSRSKMNYPKLSQIPFQCIIPTLIESPHDYINCTVVHM